MTVSKAADRSSRMRTDDLESAFAIRRASVTDSSAVSVETVTLQSSEHLNDQTQKQFLPSSNPSHEHLTIIMVHTLFINLSKHILIYISNLHIS